jgi:hypothetical protein
VKALTLWQPWASLVAMGVKKYEFRRWKAPAAIVGERIVIHAAKRPIDKRRECAPLLADRARLSASLGTLGLDDIKRENEARAFLVAALGDGWIPYSCGIATARLGTPQRAIDLFAAHMDPSEIDPDMWAWPMEAVEEFRKPVPARGAQGFWNWQQVAPDLFEHGGTGA